MMGSDYRLGSDMMEIAFFPRTISTIIGREGRRFLAARKAKFEEDEVVELKGNQLIPRLYSSVYGKEVHRMTPRFTKRR